MGQSGQSPYKMLSSVVAVKSEIRKFGTLDQMVEGVRLLSDVKQLPALFQGPLFQVSISVEKPLGKVGSLLKMCKGRKNAHGIIQLTNVHKCFQAVHHCLVNRLIVRQNFLEHTQQGSWRFVSASLASKHAKLVPGFAASLQIVESRRLVSLELT